MDLWLFIFYRPNLSSKFPPPQPSLTVTLSYLLRLRKWWHSKPGVSGPSEANSGVQNDVGSSQTGRYHERHLRFFIKGLPSVSMNPCWPLTSFLFLCLVISKYRAGILVWDTHLEHWTNQSINTATHESVRLTPCRHWHHLSRICTQWEHPLPSQPISICINLIKSHQKCRWMCCFWFSLLFKKFGRFSHLIASSHY